MMDRNGESLHRPAGGPPPFNKGGSGGESKTVEYTMTARIELTLVGLTDTADMEALVRDYWNGYLKAACDAIDSKVPMDDIKLSEIKIFARDME